MVTRLNVGGPSLHVAVLSTRLDPSRYSTCLVIGQPEGAEGDLSHLVEGSPVRLIRIPSLRRTLHPWADLRSLVQLLRVCWRERPRIIHTHMAKAGALGRVAGLLYNGIGPGRAAGSRAVLLHTFHGHVLEGYFPLWVSRLFVIIERWLARRSDCLIAVSPAVQRELVEKGIGRASQWRLIRLGLDLGEFSQLPLPNGASPLRVGLIGRLVPIKNPQLFIRAFGRMREHQPALLGGGVIVGDGPLRQALEQEASQLGLREAIQFIGWQRDLRPIYNELDVVCLTSWNEGTPVSLIEAMAAGRALVATEVGGVRDLLDEEPGPPASEIPPGGFRVAARGLLVRPGDCEGLAAALERLAADAILRRRLGEACRRYALETFNAERLVREITALYDTLTKEG